ncbi:MAG: hypothetical protein GX575_23115 [Candidatus Anammoximicrobium sp.]|nr:hypothetical protein [Candidatus Anammoximicrobium sp.]
MSIKPGFLSTQQPSLPHVADQHVRRLMEVEQRMAESQYGADACRRPRSVGIVGAGVMGASIAAAVAGRQIPVVMVDENAQALATVRQRISSWLQARPAANEAARVDLDRLVRFGGLDEAAQCDVVVESVAEKIAVKQQVLTDLEPRLAAGAILASNTSTIPFARLSSPLRDPGRLCGCHFFLPIGQAPMLEIIRGEKTHLQTVAAAVGFARAIGHLPLVVADVPGFVVNRLLVPYLSAAMQLLVEGVTVEAVESAAERFGMLCGPLRLMDGIGLDTALQCGWAISEDSSDLVAASPLLVAMVKARQLGCKARAGFFLYEADEPTPQGLNPALQAALARCPQTPRPHTAETVIWRLLAPMLLEATRMLQRGDVRDAGQIDLAVVLGFGFPASRGGLLYWADTVGAARIVEWFDTLDYLGDRAEPTPLLRKMSQCGRMFYA